MSNRLLIGERHQLPVIRQSEVAECGLACLAMVASYYGNKVDLNTLRRRHPISLNGVTLKTLIQIAGHLHFSCRALRFELCEIRELKTPAILHWDFNHFVVLKSATSRKIVIHDPNSGVRSLSYAEASKHITGVALELIPTHGFAKKDERSTLPLSTFFQHVRGMKQSFAQLIALSVLLEVLTIAAPFYMQLTVDEVIARHDHDLLSVLALGFLLLTFITVGTKIFRSQVVLMIENLITYQMGSRLFRHLLRLPLAWFEKRHVGDILSRFSSLEPIQKLLSEGLIVALLDGVLAMTTLVMILFYSPLLGGVVCAAVASYVLLRIVLYQMFRERSETLIQARALENSNFIESVRALQSVKLFNRETDRETQWMNRYSDVVNANVRLGRARILFQTCNGLIFGIENILTIYLAARLALANALTIGMVFAFMAFKNQFIQRSVSLVEKTIDLRLISLHLERISDIALSEVEKGHDRVLSYLPPVSGRLELRNVSFQYSETDRLVLDDINLTIHPKEFVTIKGPSGRGKTTLMKVMLGLLEPTRGEILVDGIPLATLGVRAYREQIAAVMQEDQLLSGSIADNITFFASDFDQNRMMQCAETACVHEDIMKMPMAYNSLVGDMGSSLSSGQKQRLLLARALYRNPKILFLDEGTAHLDVEKEKEINANLRGLGITIISIAHRPGFVQDADKVFEI